MNGPYLYQFRLDSSPGVDTKLTASKKPNMPSDLYQRHVYSFQERAARVDWASASDVRGAVQ